MQNLINILGFNVFNNKGVYAVLLGSGLSRAAGIPTGWEITLDLVRQLAAIEGVEVGPAPEQWYLDKTGKAPDYSDLLGSLGETQGERQAILSRYIEPSESDPEAGLKMPTNAHHALAHLVRQGYIRVILTTNFDRLGSDFGRDPAMLKFMERADEMKDDWPPIQAGIFKTYQNFNRLRQALLTHIGNAWQTS